MITRVKLTLSSFSLDRCDKSPSDVSTHSASTLTSETQLLHSPSDKVDVLHRESHLKCFARLICVTMYCYKNKTNRL